MNFKKNKVLVVATSRNTRGGITSVIKAHELGAHWSKYHCKWIETHRDGFVLRKLGYFIYSFIQFCCLIPFYDLAHIHVATESSAKRKRLFIYVATLFKKKVILHFHPSNEKFLFYPENKELYTRIFKSANLVLVLSDQWKIWIRDALGITDNISVLHNPCPTIQRKYQERGKYILFAGTIIPRKGYETLIRGFAKIAPKFPEWKVVFAGNGEIDNATKIAEEVRILEQVQFLGWVSGSQKMTTFEQASIYCLASEGEGFPMSVLDAWAYGIPCVMTPVGGIPDFVIEGVNGLLFPVGDIDKLAIQLEKLMKDESLRKSIVIEADRYVYQEFNQDVINKKLGEIYFNILNQ